MFHLTKAKEEKALYVIFEVSIIAKGIHAIIEVISGIFVLLITKDFIIRVVSSLTQDELGEDPKDFIAHYFMMFAQQFSINSQHFIAFYLLSHGIVKGFLAYNLLKERLWAYPASIAVFGVFILYQLVRYTYTHSPWLIALSVFDVLVLWLIWHEYKLVRKRQVA